MDLFSEAEEIMISSSSRRVPLDRSAHIATFAFLLWAGRQAGNSETVLAIKDKDELAKFFSKRYLNEGGEFVGSFFAVTFICIIIILLSTGHSFVCYVVLPFRRQFDSATQHII